ncbi:FAD-dependent oxidoreductase [Maribacter hydrothermalis]|uniref:Oxidoreductase n=1 Tax=Maribacter hydrothermalis TaxID=1836467 RepID=A0A1B7ZCH0_9FLAO|nr:FAD-dependent oxidoreductase [Maribacter hydrothermalis]APQ18617.1 oxidoreductase [Maribacter hydrothermalis]OBR40827.1 oxidoreductase [Maribacter hydrothermalis]
MKNSNLKVHIVGAGISGLVAAAVLEQNGYSPVIIEATNSVGGRVKTAIVDGYQLDHGFQVLLSAYPAAKKYLDFDSLELQTFLPGAVIFKYGKELTIGDPLRDVSFLFSTLFSGIGNFSDKIKILKLNRRLKKKSLSSIFSENEQTTLLYLRQLGFSNEIIEDFFTPFFSGIFLENKLNTSSRMFEFVYKMFGEGYATIPKAGIGAIPKQLAKNLNHTVFKFNTKVATVLDGQIELENGEKLASDYTIVATEASNLIPNLKNQKTEWKSSDTIYFETTKRVINKPLIGLVPVNGSLINSIFYPTSLGTISKNSKELLSVTIVDNQNLPTKILIERVQQELKRYCAIESCSFIKHYKIPNSLPVLNNLQYDMLPSETRLNTGVFLAGDTLLNGSLNAAMIAGEMAALGVVEAITNTKR